MPEKASRIVVDACVHGRGNEYTVSDLVDIDVDLDGEDPENFIAGIPNGAFFGWQTPEGAVMQSYIDIARDEYGFRFREGLQIVELEDDCVIEKVVRDRKELLRNILRQITVGAVMKFVTKQFNWELLPRPRFRRYADFVRVEKRSDKPCMTMSDLADPYWGPKLRDFLEDRCERMASERGLMADPLGGAAISGAFKYLMNPTIDPVLSNLEKGDDGEIVLSDAGMIRMHESERVSNIPKTEWAMLIALRGLMELSYEAMNMALRDYGHDIKPRKWGVTNALSKIIAGIGYLPVRLARKFWGSKFSDFAQGFVQETSRIA